MGKLKKVISLHQASVISGYNQDYLSSLIRKREIKGEKIGGNWVTTYEEIENYIYRQKIRNKGFLAKQVLYFLKRNSSLIFASILLLVIGSAIYVYNREYAETKTALQKSEAEISAINKLQAEREFRDLQF